MYTLFIPKAYTDSQKPFNRYCLDFNYAYLGQLGF